VKIELVGWGAMKTHNATRVFKEKTIRSPTIKVVGKTIKINVCNRCRKEIPKRWRFCVDCKKKQQLDSQRKWRRNRG